MSDLTILDSVGSAGEAALDTVVGGAALALDSVSRPRRTARRARRRGSEAAGAIAETTSEVTALPERVLVAYVRLLRSNARREDVVGTVSRGVLGAMHVPAREGARFLLRLEKETAIAAAKPVRGGARRSKRTTRRRTA